MFHIIYILLQIAIEIFQICPDFLPAALEKILDIVYTGKTTIGQHDKPLFEEMKSIVECLQIDISWLRCEVEEKEESVDDEDDVEFDEEMDTDLESDDGCTYSEDSDSEMTKSAEKENNKALPYKCTICGKEFGVSIALKKHFAKHQSEEEKLQVSEEEESKGQNVAKEVLAEKDSENFEAEVEATEKEDIALKKDLEKHQNREVQVDEESTSQKFEKEVSAEKDSEHIDRKVMLEVDNLDNFVGTCCPRCDELIRQKDLEEHLKTCDANGGGFSDKEGEEKLNQEKSRLEIPEPTNGEKKLYRVDNQDPAKANLELHTCTICSKKCMSYSGLVFHLTNRHFQNKLVGFCEGTKCSICQKSFNKKSKVLLHLAWKHKVLGDLIPKKKKNQMKKKLSSKMTGFVAEEITLKESTEDKTFEPKSNQKKRFCSKFFYCHLCSHRVSRLNHLRIHISTAHFRKELLQRFEKGKLQVNDCFIFVLLFSIPSS